jgi:outer membrane PBP1 activator LpoA protein
MAIELHGIDRVSLVTLLREAAAHILDANARADAAEVLANEERDSRAESYERLSDAKAQAADAEQRAISAERTLSLVEERLGAAQDKAERAQARALDAEKENHESIARATAAEARVRMLEARLERARVVLEADVDEPSLDALVGFVADAMSERQGSRTQADDDGLQNAA